MNQNEWINNSQQWQDELEGVLTTHGGNDVVTQYTNVAFAFPSTKPNPYSFDYPLIDKDRLVEWADSKGWEVRFAPEMLSQEDKQNLPPVRFTKKT